MKKLSILIAIIALILFTVGNTNAQTDAWWDGGSLENVDLCPPHEAPNDFGFPWLAMDLVDITNAYQNLGMTGPVKAVEKQLDKLESWLGTHGDGIVNFDVRNRSKVDNILRALMEIGDEIMWEGINLDNYDLALAGWLLFMDAEHCLNVEYWGM